MLSAAFCTVAAVYGTLQSEDEIKRSQLGLWILAGFSLKMSMSVALLMLPQAPAHPPPLCWSKVDHPAGSLAAVCALRKARIDLPGAFQAVDRLPYPVGGQGWGGSGF